MRRCATFLLLLLALVALLAGCGGSKGTSETTSSKTSASASTATTTGTSTTGNAQRSVGCPKVAKPAPKGPQHLRKPRLRLDPRKRWTATLTTNCGAFTIALDVKRAPRTSASFAALARKGFYDHLIFHRIAPGFVIQGGDPLGNGTSGPGYSVVEAPPSDVQYTRGVVAMAKAGNEPPGASGSQFFVMLADNQLPPDYALLGKVVNGLDVVDAIGDRPLADPGNQMGSPPVDPVVIESVKVAAR